MDVLCSGKIDSLYLLKAFEFGADGVFVAGCAEGQCHNEKGNVHAGQRVGYIQGLLKDIGIGAERLEMLKMSPEQCLDLREAVMALSAKVKELGPNPVRHDVPPQAGRKG